MPSEHSDSSPSQNQGQTTDRKKKGKARTIRKLTKKLRRSKSSSRKQCPAQAKLGFLLKNESIIRNYSTENFTKLTTLAGDISTKKSSKGISPRQGLKKSKTRD
jgi:hypothetical protein